VLVGGVAYYASMDTYVYAVDAATGSLRWRTKNSGSNISLAVCGNYVFSSYISLAILDRASGVLRSRSKGSEVFRDFAVAGERGYAVSQDALYAYQCE
jgi:outer membrane protein assembly factor BamB